MYPLVWFIGLSCLAVTAPMVYLTIRDARADGKYRQLNKCAALKLRRYPVIDLPAAHIQEQA